MENPFKLTIYDKAFKRLGWLGDALEVHPTPRHNIMGSLDFSVASNNAKLPLMLQPGARMTCHYLGEQIISGPVRLRGGKGPSSQGIVTLSVDDDFRLLNRLAGWPVPENALSNQNLEYCTITGPAETVAKSFISRNMGRLGQPITVAPDLGRGQTITVTSRFHPLFDRLFPAVETAGIGVSVVQSGAGLLVDCYVPKTYPRVLSEESGVVTEWSWSNAAPDATRGVIGGGGKGIARTFQAFSNTTRESAWGDVIEMFLDARDTTDPTIYTSRANQKLAETGEKSGLMVKFSETENFRYGTGGVERGDLVTLAVGPGLVITDTLREAAMSWTRANGLQIQPQVGDVTNSTDLVMGRAVRNIASDVRNFRSQ